MKYWILLLLGAPLFVSAQQDTAKELMNVEVRAFNLGQSAFSTPATVSVVNAEAAVRFGEAGWVPVLNTVAGVRMEERSPGSYRLSVRGSLLRSPFGIRNIKMYWNQLSLTDAGGNTYFNLLDRSSISGMEVLKGPGGSLYGSGTGGVVLLRDDMEKETRITISGGSYGAFSAGARKVWGNDGNGYSVNAHHQQADGYRDHSQMRRTNLLTSGKHRRGKWDANWLLFATDLMYETPGGLNLAQFTANPADARPATPVVPGAIQQKAAIYNKTIFTGAYLSYAASELWSHGLALTGTYTDFKNPFITNYEERAEPGFTGRYHSSYKKAKGHTLLQLEAGAEYGYQAVKVSNYDNNGGEKGNIQYDDRIRTWYLFPFLQTMVQWKKNWNLQAGMSYNVQGYKMRRLTDTDTRFRKKENDPQLLPRLALQRTLSTRWSAYGVIGKGYSAPSVAEIRPSDGSFRTELQSEYGWNKELGLRYRTADKRIRLSVNAFRFGLQETIVRRIAGNGGEYFVNAGETLQQGLEAEWEVQLVKPNNEKENDLNWWGAFTWSDFRFKAYKAGNDDYSGNKVTGIPGHTVSSGLGWKPLRTWRFSLNGYYCAAIPLNDASNEKAEPYLLAQAKLEKTFQIKQAALLIYFAGDNLLDETYSLGNDLNAVGRRYYNAAPRRSIETGVHLSW